MGPDDLPVQCAGQWVPEKHDYLRRYIEATRSVRSKYTEGSGGAAYIDLFAGPGLARVKERKTIIDGSPIIAASHDQVPFTHIVACDTSHGNVAALRSRLSAYQCENEVLHGDCNERISEIVSCIPEYGLNIALIDPFGAKTLLWETIKALGEIKRMDLIIHFPTGTLKRNLSNESFRERIDAMLGTTRWRKLVMGPSDVVRLIDVLREQLVSLGYEAEKVRDLPIRNNVNNILYHLVYASKHALGSSIWDSVAQTSAGGQRSFKF